MIASTLGVDMGELWGADVRVRAQLYQLALLTRNHSTLATARAVRMGMNADKAGWAEFSAAMGRETLPRAEEKSEAIDGLWGLMKAVAPKKKG